MPFALIFISGGAILALELLASRIMTPYFGVSLYIWTGILSITLISLAFGYWWGGRLAGGAKAPTPQRLALLFSITPATEPKVLTKNTRPEPASPWLPPF